MAPRTLTGAGTRVTGGFHQPDGIRHGLLEATSASRLRDPDRYPA